MDSLQFDAVDHTVTLCFASIIFKVITSIHIFGRALEDSHFARIKEAKCRSFSNEDNLQNAVDASSTLWTRNMNCKIKIVVLMNYIFQKENAEAII